MNQYSKDKLVELNSKGYSSLVDVLYLIANQLENQRYHILDQWFLTRNVNSGTVHSESVYFTHSQTLTKVGLFIQQLKPLKLITLAVVCLCNTIAFAEVENSQNVQSFTYSVIAKGVSLGNLLTMITRNGEDKNNETYTIESITKPSRMAALFLKGQVVERCKYSLGPEQQVIGESYSSLKTGKSSYQGSLVYDWKKRRISYNGLESVDMPIGYILDNCNFYVAVSLKNLEIFKNNQTFVFDAKESKYREYSYVSLENEMLSTKYGELQTQKLTLVRSGNSDRSLIFWLSEKFPLSPLKVVDQRKNRKVVLKLIAYTDVGKGR